MQRRFANSVNDGKYEYRQERIEDELKEAFNNGIITKKDIDLVYNTLSKLQSKYADNINYLVELTREIYKFIL